jgi:hypothetical protein
VYSPKIRADIVNFVKGSWTDDLLDEVYTAVTQRTVMVASAVNFTSPGGQATAAS